jgi:glycosyltransferase involved in cell wall biosynthesis
MARVSVLLPARDAEATVERAVRSVLAQTLEDLELVAVDDGSRDGTRPLLERLAKEDARVRVVTGAGQGLVAALNLGLRECRAPLVARMDADDESLPERLARSVAALDAQPELVGVGTQVQLFREDQPVSPAMQDYADWLNGLTSWEALYRDRFVESPLCHPSVTLRRQPILDAGGYRGGDFPEDYELWLRLMARGHRLLNLAPVLLRWRDHASRLTRVDPRYARDRFRFLKARYIAKGLAPGPLWIWGAGPNGRMLARDLRAEGRDILGFIDIDPRKVGRVLAQGARVFAPEHLPPPGEHHLLAAVGVKGAREDIRARLTARGWTELAHYTCTA